VFPVYAGIHKWAPLWIRQLGLEWLYRLAQEPRRLWKRYYQTIPPFVYLALKQLLRQLLIERTKPAKASEIHTSGVQSHQ
jgi:N-acetylglucosaminyldiphosphoundecaprenol N-acetyl-beta-D-mannosaminyltransferase